MTGSSWYGLLIGIATIAALGGVACTDGSSSTSDASPSDDAGGESSVDGGGSSSDAGDGGECNGYPSFDPASVMVAGRLPSDPAIDGELTEDFYGVLPSLMLSGAARGSDNEVTVRAGWTAEHLYVAARVTDAQIETGDSAPASNDGIELFFDTDSDGGDGLAADDHHWIVPADGEAHTERGSDTDAEPATDIALDVATIQGDGSYVIELSAPLADLGLDPSGGDRVGFLVAANDVDGGEHVAFAWRDVLPFKQPDEWGELQFARTSCAAPADAGTPDAGPADAGTPDAGTGSTDPIGGGPGYSRTVCRSDADAIIMAASELRDVIESAESGDVVYIDETAEWDVTGVEGIVIPAGVTLSGGRGCDGAPGALLYVTERKHDYIFETDGEDVRFTGIRLRGAVYDRTTLFDPEGDHYSHNGLGARFSGARTEIDNNHIYGFTSRNLQTAGTEIHVHHNRLTRSLMEGLGYGVSVSGDALIEHNYFEYNRHAIASGDRSSYEAAYNIVGPNMTGHHFFDMHPDGGATLRFHHNTFQTDSAEAIMIRGTPSDGAWVENNWFYHPEEPDCDGANNEAWWMREGCENIHIGDNHFGEVAPPSCDFGAPREGCPAP